MSKTATQDKFRVDAKKRLIEQRLSVTRLAQKLGFARNTVSMAINHPVLPTVMHRVAKELKLEPRP